MSLFAAHVTCSRCDRIGGEEIRSLVVVPFGLLVVVMSTSKKDAASHNATAPSMSSVHMVLVEVRFVVLRCMVACCCARCEIMTG